MAPGILEILALAALVLGAAILHWYLRRVARRLRHRASGGPARLREGLLLLLRSALWIGVGWILVVRVPQLDMSREILLRFVRHSLEAPLFTMNGRAYSALHLLALPAMLLALWFGVSAVVGLAKRQLARLAGGVKGVHESVAILARLVLSFLGAIVLCQAWGLDVSSLTFVASVLGVGIGFGLQNIANNFVSGILLGLERPMQPGDFVRVGGFAGTVRRIGARSTQIETSDQVTILIPNARFLENEVTNWSYGSPISRLRLPVRVAETADPVHARAALLAAAATCPDVLVDPRPQVRFLAFGAEGLDFELLAFTAEPRGQSRVKSELNFAIRESLMRFGVSLPSSQQDVSLTTPALVEAVRAWSTRHFSESELAAARTSAPAPAPVVALPATPRTRDLDVDDEELARIVDALRGENGVEIADRRHLLRTHRRCFIGSEAVAWWMREEGLTHDEALKLGRLLVARGVIHHVLDEHGFRDGNFFYRFQIDETREGSGNLVRRAASNASDAA